MAFGKRKPLHKWSPERLEQQVPVAFVSNDGYRASCVFHVPDVLIPEAEAAERGPLSFYVMFFSYEPEDAPDFLMGGHPGALIKAREEFGSLEESRPEARSWIEGDAMEVRLKGLPGVYQWALYDSLGGDPTEPTPGTFAWFVQDEHGETELRKFPPDLR